MTGDSELSVTSTLYQAVGLVKQKVVQGIPISMINIVYITMTLTKSCLHCVIKIWKGLYDFYYTLVTLTTGYIGINYIEAALVIHVDIA